MYMCFTDTHIIKYGGLAPEQRGVFRALQALSVRRSVTWKVFPFGGGRCKHSL